jgi:hypothetical protein
MIRYLLALMIAMLFGSVALADTTKVTGFYSNMRFGTEDVSGVEIFISYSDRGHFAYVQCAEGGLSTPVLVPVSEVGSTIEFIIPPAAEKNVYACPSGKFTGVVTPKGLDGHFERMKWPGFLKRKGSYWQ